MERAFGSKGFLIGMIGVVISAALGIAGQAWDAWLSPVTSEPGFTLMLVDQAFESQYFLFVVPILAALPFTGAFVEDVQNRFVRCILPRTGRSAYLISRILVTGLAGGGVLVLGAALMLGAFLLVFWPLESAPPANLDMEEQTGIWMGVFFEHLALLFLSGFLWAVAGSLFAAVTMNPYMGLAAPFIFYYVLIILYERYFPQAYTLDPRQWLWPGELWKAGVAGAALLVGELCVAVSAALGWVMEKRMRNV